MDRVIDIGAALRAETVMQWRRQGFWLTYAFMAVLLVLLTVQSALFFKKLPSDYFEGYVFTESTLQYLLVFGSTAYGALLLGLVSALLVADRLERDRRLGMLELQRSTPQPSGAYVLGKFLGNYAALLVPLGLIFLLCGLVTLLLGWPPVLILKFMQVFVLVTIPSSTAAVGVILLLTSILPQRLVQVGFVMLWFEFYIGLGWHGLAASVWNVSGAYVLAWFIPGIPDRYSVYQVDASGKMVVLNIVALLLTSAAALALTYGSLALQRYRLERM